MTSTEITMAIAEACGWKGPRHPDNIGGMEDWWSQNRDIWYMRPEGVRVMLSSVPDCFNDLNAMHAVEEALNETQRDAWCRELEIVLRRTGKHSSFEQRHATAAQRAEAILRTLGKWKE